MVPVVEMRSKVVYKAGIAPEGLLPWTLSRDVLVVKLGSAFKHEHDVLLSIRGGGT